MGDNASDKSFKVRIRNYRACVLFVFLAVSVSACGGSSGSGSEETLSAQNFSGVVGSEGQLVRVVEPAEGSVFEPGATIAFRLETENFTLAPPFDRRPARESDAVLIAHHVDAEDVDLDALEEAAADAGLLEDEMAHGHSHSDESDSSHHADTSHDSGSGHAHGSAGHSHDGISMNTTAREGHYHVYLNEATGSDPHLTSWSNQDVYELPSDISPGMHTLRFELRDNNHVLVGAETVVMFEVAQ